MPHVEIATLGFTKKSAESFFEALIVGGVKTLVDVRLNNVSQLAGFTKRDDLKFFLERVAGITYIHEPLLAPTPEMLAAYRGGATDWKTYESRFLELISNRQIEKVLSPDLLHHSCLLCSEETPHRCHRRLVAEYLKAAWNDVSINHLGLPTRSKGRTVPKRA